MNFTDEELKVLLTDFKVYLDYVFECIGTPSPTKLQKRIADHIQKNNKRMILQAARGTGKSWIAAIYATWRLLKDPDEKVLIVSANVDLAKKISAFIRSLFDTVPLLQHMDPSKTNMDSVMSFNVVGAKVSMAPSVAVTGINGQLTGRRATLIIGDDIEIPKNSETEVKRDKLLIATREFEALLIPDKPSNILYLGTPQSMESIYTKIDRSDADIMSHYITYILPAMVPEDESLYNGKLDPWILMQGKPGTPTDLERFPIEELMQRKAGYGLSGFKLQYMLDTSLADQEKYPLKLKDLMCTSLDKIEAPVSLTYSGSTEFRIKELANIGFSGDGYQRPMRVSQEYTKYNSIIMAIDPSGTGTDETAYAILGLLNGLVYILDVGGTNTHKIREGFSDKALMMLALKAKEYSVNSIILEKNFGGGMFGKLFEGILSKVYPCTIYEVNAKGQKEVRIINAIEPLSTNHKLIINYDLVEKDMKEALSDSGDVVYSFLYQFTHLTRDRGSLAHDDRLDAVAMGCQWFLDMIGIDSEDMLEKFRREQLEKEIDMFLDKHRNTSKNVSFIKKR